MPSFLSSTPAALLPHEGSDCLHRIHRAEKIGLEHLVAGRHVSLRDGIEQAVPGVVDPDINALEMMQRQAENTIDLLRVPDVAGKRDRAILTDAHAGSLGSCGIAWKQNHGVSLPVGRFC